MSLLGLFRTEMFSLKKREVVSRTKGSTGVRETPSFEPFTVPTEPTVPTERFTIPMLRDKDVLIKFAKRELGLELDKRMTLMNMVAEIYEKKTNPDYVDYQTRKALGKARANGKTGRPRKESTAPLH